MVTNLLSPMHLIFAQDPPIKRPLPPHSWWRRWHRYDYFERHVEVPVEVLETFSRCRRKGCPYRARVDVERVPVGYRNRDLRRVGRRRP